MDTAGEFISNLCEYDNLSKRTDDVSMNKRIQPSGTDTTLSNDLQKEQVVKKIETNCEIEVDNTKKSFESEAKFKYSDTVKRFNSAATREAALLKVEDNLKQRAGNEEKSQKSENKNDSQFSKHGRNYSYENGSQPKSKEFASAAVYQFAPDYFFTRYPRELSPIWNLTGLFTKG